MKRRLLTSATNEHKQPVMVIDTESDDLPEYCVSRLPDDIIVNIFSLLSLREAARTSIVSSRWRYLWTFTANLVFVAPKMKVPKIKEERKEKVPRYVRWVNKVLELHRGSFINRFKIQFGLGDAEKSNITNWIYTAFAKGIRKIELDFFHPLMGIEFEEYIFPLECYSNLKTLSGIKSLRSLRLHYVQVTREIVEFFIYNCPHLKRLRVAFSRRLLSLRIAGSSIQLKYLDIHFCSIKEIEISAPSLLSLKYFGPQIKLHVENVPLLLDVSIGGFWGFRDVALRNFIDPIICFLPQLETLGFYLEFKEDSLPFLPLELPNLRHLTLTILDVASVSLIYLVRMIELCPFLHKFSLELKSIVRHRRTINQFPRFSHQHLKVVEFIGFIGYPIDLEFAFYLLENATMLEKMIVNLTKTYFKVGGEQKVFARKCAEELKKSVPQGVEFVIC